MPVLRCRSNRDAAGVFEQHRYAGRGAQGDVLNIGHRQNPPHPANDHRLLPGTDERSAGVSIVHLDRVGDIGDRELVFFERERVDLDVIFLDEAAEGDDIRHALDLRESRRDDPVLDLPQLHLVVPVAFEYVPVELTDACGQWTERRGDPFWQRDIPEFFQHELPGKVVVGAIRKCEFDDG
jgi:hypothetical protein